MLRKYFRIPHHKRPTTRRIYVLALTIPILVLLFPITYYGLEKAGLIQAALPAASAVWRMDEANGATVNDATSNSNSGTITNAVWRSKQLCQSENCLFFDGTGDYVTRADDADFDFLAAENFTFSVWFRHAPKTSGTDVIIAKHNATAGGYKIVMESDGDITCGIDDDSTYGPEDFVTSTAATYDDNQWHHIVCVKAATTSLTLYIDGRPVGTPDTSFAATGTLANANAFYLGIDGNGSSNPYTGFLDEFRMYRVALTAAQVLTEFNNTSALRLTKQDSDFLSDGLVGYWDMDEIAANTCTGGTNDNCDKSGNILNGAWNGNATSSMGKFGTATTLDGTGDYVSVSNNSVLQFTSAQSFSVSTWVYVPSLSGTWEGIVTKSRDSGNYYGIWISDGDEWIFGETSNNDITGPVATTGWHHVVITQTGSTKRDLYVDGVHGGSIASAYDANGSGNLVFGRGSGSSEDFSGRIDEVRIYNKALSSTDVQSLYIWAPGPSVHWKMDDNTGQTVTDVSGNGVNLTLGSSTSVETVDPLWTLGKLGSGLGFNGGTSNRYAYIDDNPFLDLNTNESITISAWVRRTDFASFNNPSIIIDKMNTGATVGYYFSIGSTSTCEPTANDGELICFYMSDGTDNYYMTTTATLTDDGVWHHIAVTMDRSSETNTLIYIDGVPQTMTRNGTFANIGDSSNGNDACVGINNTGFNCGDTQEMNGDIDDLRIYKYARTQQQILDDMKGESSGEGVGNSQVGHWKFDDMNGTTAQDSTVHNNDLTLTASPAWTSLGKINSSIDFESGSSQYSSAADSPALSLTRDLTLTAWIRPESTTASTTFPIAGKGGGAVTSYLLVQFEDELRMYVGSSANYATTNAANLTTSTWYHVTATYNATAQTVKIFVNGTEQATSVTGTIPSSISDGLDSFVVGGFTSDTLATYQISTTSDDGFEQNNTTWDDTPGGGVNGFGYYNGVYFDVEPGLRFNNVAIAQGATISTAYLQVYGDTAQSAGAATSVFGKIRGDDVDDAAAWGSSSRPTQITSTTATVDWDPSAWVNDWNNSPSIVSIIQEIVNRGGWASGNDLRIAVWNDGTTGLNVMSFEDYDVGAATAAKLVIGYSSGSNYYYDGQIDDVQVFSSALSLDQIRAVQNANASLNIGTGQNEATQITGTAETPPAGYWPFDDNTSTIAYDKSGNSNNGTLTSGPTWVNGKVGGAINFDGTDDYVTMGNPSAITNPSALTLELWLYMRAIDGQAVNYAAAKGTGGASNGWALGINGTFTGGCSGAATDNIYFYTNLTFACSTSVMPLNTWTHIAISHSGGSTRMYINGVLESTTSQTLQVDNAYDLNIGRRSDTSFPINGMIDDVKFYTYARTQAQIAYDLNRGAPKAWWKFDEGSGTTSNDASGNSYTGTLTGTPTWGDGRFNTGITLNGSTQYSTVSDSANIRFDANTQDFSVFAWVKRSSSGSEMNIVSKEDADNDGYRLQFTSGNIVRCSVNTIDIDSTVTITDTTNWHLVGCTITRAGNGQVYIDGKPTGTATAISSTAMATTTGLRIGARSYTVANYFAGTVDDVRLYNYALTQSQIRKLLNEGAGVRYGPASGSP